MTIYIMTLAAAVLLGLLMKPNSSQKKKRKYMVIVFIMIILISALRKYTVGKDLTAHYYNSYLRIRDLPWNAIFSATSYEAGFVVFYKVIGVILKDPQWMIAIYSVFVFGIVGWFIYKNSEDVVLSVFLFIACNTWFMDLNIMKQAMAISMGLVATEVWKQKRWKLWRYILFGLAVALATSFHSSGIVIAFFPVFERLPFKRRQIIEVMVALAALFVLYEYFYRFAAGIISLTRDYADFYKGTGYGSTSVTAFALFELFVAALCFGLACWTIVYRGGARRTKVDNSGKLTGNSDGYSNNFLLYMVLLLVVCRLLRMRIYIITRMAYYFIPFMWILYPRAIKGLKLASNRMVVRRFLYILFTVVFLLVGFRNAADYYGTVPYEFFWR